MSLKTPARWTICLNVVSTVQTMVCELPACIVMWIKWILSKLCSCCYRIIDLLFADFICTFAAVVAFTGYLFYVMFSSAFYFFKVVQLIIVHILLCKLYFTNHCSWWKLHLVVIQASSTVVVPSRPWHVWWCFQTRQMLVGAPVFSLNPDWENAEKISNWISQGGVSEILGTADGHKDFWCFGQSKKIILNEIFIVAVIVNHQQRDKLLSHASSHIVMPSLFFRMKFHPCIINARKCLTRILIAKI